MRNKIIKFLSLSLVALLLFLLNYDVIFKDKKSFERLNGISLIDRIYSYLLDAERYDRYVMLAKQYEKSLLVLEKNEQKLSIPRKIHHIWLGSKVPAKYKFYREKCIDLHPGWEFKLWTMADVEKEKFASAYLLKDAISYAEMSDVIRYEIINRYGGIYLDMDIDCFKNFAPIVSNFDYWFNTEAQISAVFTNAIFASKPGSIIIRDALRKVKQNYHDTTEVDKKYAKRAKKLERREIVDRNHTVAVLKTMLPLGDSVNQQLTSPDNKLILPAAYCDKPYIFKANILDVISRIKGFLFYKQYVEFILPDLYCAQLKRGSFDSYLSSPSFNMALTAKRALSLKSLMISFYAPNHQQLEAFKLLYDKNYPGNRSFAETTMIQKNIYLINGEAGALQVWQNKLPGLNIEIIDKAKITALLHENGFLLSSDEEFNGAVAGLLLVQKNGGMVVNNPNFRPHHNYLREILYKYESFFVTEPGERKSPVLLSSKIFGAIDNSALIDKIIARLKAAEARTSEELQNILSEILFDQISFVAKSTIVFPAAQFFGKEKNNASFTYEDS